MTTPSDPLALLGVLAVRLVKRDAPPRTATVVAAAGSFAAISTLLGSPLLGAFLLMEASGLGGAMLELVLVPGLLAAGVGSLVFIGLDAWTGLGTFSLAIPGLPHVGTGGAIGDAARSVRDPGLGCPSGGCCWSRRAGLAVAGLAIAFAAGTGKGSSEVLFSGQSALGPFITGSASYTVGALLLLLVCKGLAYGVSLSGFRGGPAAARVHRPLEGMPAPAWRDCLGLAPAEPSAARTPPASITQLLLTGRSHHAVGMGGIPEFSGAFPGYSAIGIHFRYKGRPSALAAELPRVR